MELKYVVKEETNLIKILKDELFISNILYRKIKKDYIFVNGTKIDYKTILKPNDIITIKLDFNENNSNIVANKDIKFNILYEDEWLLAANKSANLAVHPSMRHYDISLSNGVKYYYDTNNLNKKIRPINRLDKDTSGIVIFAKSEYIQDNIKILDKEYLALSLGKFDKNKGIIDKPIKRKENSIIERCISSDGEKAITHFEVLNSFFSKEEENYISLVNCKLETGRTHQIRVHLSSINHPILGDTLYGMPSKLISRQALHCFKMKFIHPVTKKEITINSPIPNDMKKIIDLMD